MEYQSTLAVESRIMPGVRFVIRKISLSGRVEMTRRVRELAEKVEFLNAGESTKEKLDSALLAAEIDRSYLAWGLREVTGMTVDGSPATPDSLIECGPENLVREALAAVKAQFELSEDERKN
jgi:hypothetical protein